MRVRMLGFLPLAMLALAIGLRWIPVTSEYIDRLAGLSWDAFQRTAPRPYQPLPVRIVDIDDASLAEFGQWPWPRILLGAVVQKLREAGAASIAFDIVFAEPDRMSPNIVLPTWRKAGSAVLPALLLTDLPDHDAIFAKTVAGAPDIVVGQILKNGVATERAPQPKAGFAMAGADPLVFVPPFDGIVTNLPPIEAGAKGAGFLNHDPEWDRIVRRVPLLLRYRDQTVPSLAAEALRVAMGATSYTVKGAGANATTAYGHNSGMVWLRIGQTIIPTDRAGNVWLHYTEPRTERTISAKDILSGSFDHRLIDGNIVLVGSSYAGGNDFVATPLTPVMAGLEVHAQLIEQVLLGWFLERPDWAQGAESIFIVAAGLLLIVVLPRVRAVWSAALGLAAVAGAIGTTWLAFADHRMLFDPVYPTIVVVLVYGAASLLGYVRTEMRQREVRQAFGHYMSPVLVDELASHPEKLVLGGEVRTMTILFCDVRGFTTISETMTAVELTCFMNAFVSPMTEIIIEHRGYIDKYIGDCIMAFWNAPLDDPEHAPNAIRAAEAMRRRLEELNSQWARDAAAAGEPYTPLKIGIGINTGECCVGNMGSAQRFNYSVLGDTVNVASRLEGLGKRYGVDIIVGERTAELCPNLPLVELDLVAARGKSKPVKIYTLLPEADATAPQAEAAPALCRHRELLAAYRAQDWVTALRLLEDDVSANFSTLAECYAVYRRRIKSFLEAPPPPEWDGVYVATD
jgi:adenylate cyclase